MASVINNIKEYFSPQEFSETTFFWPTHPVVCVCFQKLKEESGTHFKVLLKLMLVTV